MKLNDMFLIVSTPTMVIVRPDGVVDSVLTLVDQNFAQDPRPPRARSSAEPS